MLLNELLEAQPKKTAVVAWGRMNPPTIGHQKVLDVVNQHAQKFMGDPILFLTKTQKPKTDPLSFAEKLHFAQEMFNVPVDTFVIFSARKLNLILSTLEQCF